MNGAMRVIVFISLCFFFATHITMVTLAVDASKNPDRTVIVDWNEYGEFNLEYLLLLLSVPFTLITFCYLMWQIAKESHEARRGTV